MAASTQFQYHKSNGASIVEYTYNDGVSYEKGDFRYAENESGFSSPHNPPPRKPSPQNVLKISDKDLKVIEETVLRKAIPGIDGRKRVDNSDKYPYCIHAQLEMSFSDGSYGGSGSMVGPHHMRKRQNRPSIED